MHIGDKFIGVLLPGVRVVILFRVIQLLTAGACYDINDAVGVCICLAVKTFVQFPSPIHHPAPDGLIIPSPYQQDALSVWCKYMGNDR